MFRSRFYFVYDVLQWIGLLGGSSEKVLFILDSVLIFDRLCSALAFFEVYDLVIPSLFGNLIPYESSKLQTQIFRPIRL